MLSKDFKINDSEEKLIAQLKYYIKRYSSQIIHISLIYCKSSFNSRLKFFLLICIHEFFRLLVELVFGHMNDQKFCDIITLIGENAQISYYNNKYN